MNETSIQPYAQRILCRIVLRPIKSAGGIFLPTIKPDSDKTDEAIIQAIGPDCKLPVKPGDHVLFDKHKGLPMTHEKVEYVLFEPEDIFAVLEPS